MKITIIGVKVIFLSSCVVNHPVAYVSKPDYNRRADVFNAHYERKMTATGYTMLGVSAAGGAAAGWFTPMVSYYDGNQRENFAPANAAIGAVIGFGASYFISRMMGWGSSKHKPAKDPGKWLKKSNSQYIVLDEITSQKFTVIHRSAESNYTVQNMADVHDFRKVFPSSIFSDDVVKQSVERVKRNELIQVLEYYPSSIHVMDVKKKYVTSSTVVKSMYAAADLFPETNLNVETLSVPLVIDIDDALTFYERFPSSTFSQKVVAKSFTTPDQAKHKILALKDKYKDDFFQGPDDVIVQESTAIKRNYLDALYRIENPQSLYNIEAFYDDYIWLQFPQKPTDIANNYWNVAYSSYDEGSYILYLMRNLASNSSYKKFEITSKMMDDFIKAKLRDEVTSKVKINSTMTIGTTNDEWNNWCNNPDYTAGLVAEVGQIEYMVYGEVENKSKFDLPVEINVKGNLNREVTYQGTGFWTNLFSAVLNEGLSSDSKIGSSTTSFIIPLMKSHSSSSYAAKLDFGDGNKRTGVNFNDWVKYKSELYLSGATATPSYSDHKPARGTLKNQESWLYLAQNGMPNVALTDLWRGEDVEEAEWKEREVAYEERRRRLAEERNRLAAMRMESGDCVMEIESPVSYGLGVLEYKRCNRTVQVHRVYCLNYAQYDIYPCEGKWFEINIGFGSDYDTGESNQYLAAKKLCGCK